MRAWRNDATLIISGALFGALLLATCFNLWPDTGDTNGVPTHPFWRFLWQWQTITAGVLALSGAALTVRAIGRQIDQADRVAEDARRATIAGQNRSIVERLDVVDREARRLMDVISKLPNWAPAHERSGIAQSIFALIETSPIGPSGTLGVELERVVALRDMRASTMNAIHNLGGAFELSLGEDEAALWRGAAFNQLSTLLGVVLALSRRLARGSALFELEDASVEALSADSPR